MGKVRTIKRDDIPLVVDLNIRLFPSSTVVSRDEQIRIFDEVCFNNPWHDPEIQSLVYEDEEGFIKGFLGVTSRKMEFNGKTVRVAVGEHVMTDGITLGSAQLFKQFLNGPQDVAMVDMATNVVRNILERMDAKIIFLHSIYWRRPLRPFTFSLSFVHKESLSPLMFSASRLLSKGFDAVVKHIPVKPFRFVPTNTIAEELEIDSMIENISGFVKYWEIIPKYDKEYLNWLFNFLKKDTRYGKFKKILVRDFKGKVLGWYLYILKSGGRSEVLQLVATKDTIGIILDNLFYDAWQGGSVELCGRLIPKFMQEIYKKYCLCVPGRNWMLIKSNDENIVNVMLNGNAFLSRLEGELWFFG
jgi:hypothetical protein